MIGLSLSFCLKDIALGRVSRNDVEKIISGTCMMTPKMEDICFKAYMKVYWKDFPEEQMRELFDWAKTIMEQPRFSENRCPCIGSGHWVHSIEEIEWFNIP